MSKGTLFGLSDMLQRTFKKGGSHGLVVMGRDSCSKGRGFESRSYILDCIVCLKRPKINETVAGVGPFFKKRTFKTRAIVKNTWLEPVLPIIWFMTNRINVPKAWWNVPTHTYNNSFKLPLDKIGLVIFWSCLACLERWSLGTMSAFLDRQPHNLSLNLTPGHGDL